MIRRSAFLQTGGFDARLFIGGEEDLVALDLAARGWCMVYVAELGAHHAPSAHRNVNARRHLLVRNAIYIALLRLPFSVAAREISVALRNAVQRHVLRDVLRDLMPALAWLRRGRRVVPPPVIHALQLLRHSKGELEIAPVHSGDSGSGARRARPSANEQHQDVQASAGCPPAKA